MDALPAVIVPVHNAPGPLSRCLNALSATVPENTRVIVIDDASTDPDVGKVLNALPQCWERLTQIENRGFVATANAGMRHVGAQDLILLNSDTIPAGDWFLRIAACAHSDPAIASITPWTNNGEIASIPVFCRNNPVPERPERWAQACVAAGAPTYPELPTAVGFCMFLRRAALDQVGDFDEEAFGRGYGEENDWCMRASHAGWKHVLCDDAFVAHEGNASFGPLGLAPGEGPMQRLLARHPEYLERVTRYIEADPLASARARVLARLS